MEKTLLIVDDEEDILSMLEMFFIKQGYQVRVAANGKEALNQIQTNPDLILLDINLPDVDGLSICKQIRSHVSCPILFVTARIEECDMLKGFSVGGDDYIVKPFSLAELNARVQAHLRRESRPKVSTKVKFTEDLVIDYGAREIYYHDQPIEFAKKEFEIIELLSTYPNQVFDKEKIYEIVWGFESDGDSSVVVEHIRRIRVKFSQFTSHSYIETVWGCGYKWIN